MNRMPSQELLTALAGLEVEIHNQAVACLGDTLDHMTGPQKEAAILSAQLDILSGELDYAHTRLKANLLHRLDTGDLWSFHPSAPNTFAELVSEKGISKSEASDLIAWETHIYRYLEARCGWKPFQVWQMLDKSKRRRLTPFLRHILDAGHETYSDKVRQGVERLYEVEFQRVLDEAKAQWAHDYSEAMAASIAVTPDWEEIGEKLLAGEGITEQEEALLHDTYTAEYLPAYDETLEVVKRLVETASTLTVRDLADHVSPESTPGIEGLVIRHQVRNVDANGEVTYDLRYQVLLTVTEDQLTLLRRRFPDRLNLMQIDGATIDSAASGQTPQR